ncbi:hypothetical protein L218DRAFT_1082384, partial [Marasmius fiardii PR-910]
MKCRRSATKHATRPKRQNAEPINIISDDDDSKEQPNASSATSQDVRMADATSSKELPKAWIRKTRELKEPSDPPSTSSIVRNIPSRTLLPSDLRPAMNQAPSGKRAKLTSSLDYSLESP